VIVRADLPNALEHFDIDALFGETGEEAADGVRRPTHGLRDLRSAGAFSAVKHSEDAGLLGFPLLRLMDIGKLSLLGSERGLRAAPQRRGRARRIMTSRSLALFGLKDVYYSSPLWSYKRFVTWGTT
jgi:hypothetical protein